MTATKRPTWRAARRPRRVIVSVSNHWRVDSVGVWCREVVVRVDDRHRITYLPDEHPALQAFLSRTVAA